MIDLQQRDPAHPTLLLLFGGGRLRRAGGLGRIRRVAACVDRVGPGGDLFWEIASPA
jgi:hypothetical protein